MFSICSKSLLLPSVTRRILIKNTATTATIWKNSFHTTNLILNNKIKDPYKTLGINSNASQSDIKKAYYKLAKKYHPDINKEENAEAKFHDLQNAYEILSDEQKRKQYDQFGPSAFDPNINTSGNSNPFTSDPFGFGTTNNPFSDFGGINFEDLFGNAFKQQHSNNTSNSNRNFFREFKGDTIHLNYNLNFKDSVFGKKNVKLNFNSFDPCNTCNGSGLKHNAHKSTCQTCNGTGTRVHIRGGFQMMSTCNDCNGEGTKIDPNDYCNHCHGDGVEFKRNKEITVDLPNALQDGDVIRVSNKGSYPQMAMDPDLINNNNVRMTRGDILIKINVINDTKFKIRDKYDIWYTMEIPITTAALGGIVTIPSIDGTNVRLRVSPGTQNDQIISIPNMGVPRSNIFSRSTNTTNRGNMKVQYKIIIKKPQSQAEKCLWEALADITNDTTAKKSNTNSTTSTQTSTKHNTQTSNTTEYNPDEPSALGRLEKFISNTFKKIKGEKNS
ncbi:hypothetical protein KAFR_0C03160 [Kazachstania africana CBS 2517]|uniref:J domain-containing protein n=1 Tax=Kazachstania africana (strain ATCC 22294 / BCRC 22015 / CBS 2517 / CECT 1963 / NBRC 1671 / NRRL Y-8276) TaxID=1071382 RepID=H2ASF8_KAZAF|nr:hypothetical protein KAFR_0C03160 [Kazachstania africana CBS 2517]CCF57308.1 hypothetical protein KAFR_0C03160 [Kazachstania africana CBS 2517]